MVAKWVGRNTGRNSIMISTRDAFNVLKQALQKDDSYAWSWHCNIAVSSMDEGMEHKAANRAAARFMYTCFDIDITKFEEYKDIMERE